MDDTRRDGRVFMLPQDYFAQLKAVGSELSNTDFMRRPQHQHLRTVIVARVSLSAMNDTFTHVRSG